MVIDVKCTQCGEVQAFNDLSLFKCGCGNGQFKEIGRHEHTGETWWENDAQNIPLAKVCVMCKDAELSRFRPEILTGYSQEDVDEPINPEDYY